MRLGQKSSVTERKSKLGNEIKTTDLVENQRFYNWFRLVSYNLMMLFYNVSNIYTKIDYEPSSINIEDGS